MKLKQHIPESKKRWRMLWVYVGKGKKQYIDLLCVIT